MHGTFSRLEHSWANKTSLHKFKKTEIIPSTFSDHNALKLEINCKKEVQKPTNMWVKEEIKGEIKRYVEKNENDNTTYQNFRNVVKAVTRKKFISFSLISRNKRNPK